MTGPATGEPDRSSAAPHRTSGTRNAASEILILLALGFALRIIIAYILPGSGFRNDLDAFRFWASKLAELGPAGFYKRDFFIDYTPGYLYALWAIGIIEKALPSLDLIKIPAILADIGVAALIWSMIGELGGGRRAALVGAGLYLFIPITWFDSVVWGQVDSVGLVFLLLAIRFLWRDQPELAVVFTVMAGIVKIQLGVILVPITAAVILRRYLWDAGGEPDPWRGTRRLFTSLAAGLGTAADPGGSVRLIDTRSHRPGAQDGGRLSVPHDQRLQPLGARHAGGRRARPERSVAVRFDHRHGGGYACPPGSEILVGPLWASIFADGLLVVIAIVVGLLVARRPDRQTILVGLAVLAIAFFVVPTRVHERYMFPFFAVAAILAGAVVALARRLSRPGRCGVRQHVRRPDDALPDQPRRSTTGWASARRSAASPESPRSPRCMPWAWPGPSSSGGPRRARRSEDEIADSADPAPAVAAPPILPRPGRRPLGEPRPLEEPGAWVPAASALGPTALGPVGRRSRSRCLRVPCPPAGHRARCPAPRAGVGRLRNDQVSGHRTALAAPARSADATPGAECRCGPTARACSTAKAAAASTGSTCGSSSGS